MAVPPSKAAAYNIVFNDLVVISHPPSDFLESHLSASQLLCHNTSAGLGLPNSNRARPWADERRHLELNAFFGYEKWSDAGRAAPWGGGGGST
jgi:hypothetical protein